MSDPVETRPPHALNGHAALPVADAEMQRIEAAYAEIRRRDAQAEYRAWRKDRFCVGLLVTLGLAIGAIIYLALLSRQVQTVVQVVQQTPDGTLVQVGVPLDLLAYSPEDGVWMTMVGQWVQHLRWRTDDEPVMRAHWAWVYRHTCPGARGVVQALEDTEKPFKADAMQAKRVTVQLKSITKTAVPMAYQVLFVETTTSRQVPRPVEHLWSATVSVGRLRPKSLDDALANRLGLCVAGFAFDPTQMGGTK